MLNAKSIAGKLKLWTRNILIRTPLQYFPVTVRKGLAKGAKWTLFPYSGYWRGYTEMDIESAIRTYGSLRGSVCWDLGAHFGIYTVGIAFAVGSEGSVYAFEPDTASFERCRRHVRMNALEQVKIFNVAVSEAEGVLDLIVGGGPGTPTSHFPYEDERADPDAGRIKVKLVALDALVESGEILPPAFVKVDVEGHGAKALRGARRTIAAHLPVIVMSFHSLWERDNTRSLLEPLGYKAYDTAGTEIGWNTCLYRTAVLCSGVPNRGRISLTATPV